MAEGDASPGTIIPARHQPALPTERFLRSEPPEEEHVPMDVVFVGGGPAGLAGAIELAKLVRDDNERGGGIGDVEIAVLEKSESLGEHCLSGAVVNPRPFHDLFPDLDDDELPFRQPVPGDRVYILTEGGSLRIPAPPTMRNHGYHIASISEIARWLGGRAEDLGVNLFTGFPADRLLVDDDRVIGVRTTPSGLDRDGDPGGAGYMPPTDIVAKVTALAEGTRGALSRAYLDWQDVSSENPQIYALGVKEIWEVDEPLDAVVHTLGWPLPNDAFGGSFFYPMADDLVALGLVVGLDYRDASLDVHELLQRMKSHPLFRRHLDGGELVEWGAKTIPEGGYYALPQRRAGDGVVILGDSAGFVDVPSLKGIHYAMQSGIYAARAIFEALKADDVSYDRLRRYDALVDESYIRDDLHARRNMRLAFKDGFYVGGAKASLMTLTGGRIPGAKIDSEDDAEVPRETGRAASGADAAPDGDAGAGAGATPGAGGAGGGIATTGRDGAPSAGQLGIRKLDAVFKSGNQTRDDVPQHLIVGEDIPPEVADFYARMCPAGVYERDGDKLVINSPNCIDCKATDVLGPRWTPREGGSGPRYRQM